MNAEVGAGGTEDEARKVGGDRLGRFCLTGYGGTDVILEVAGCHQRFLSRKSGNSLRYKLRERET